MATMFNKANEKTIDQIRKRKVISQNERIMGIIDSSIGTLICSDKRVIIYEPKMLGRWETRNIPLDHISYVNFKQGLFSGNLTVITSSGEQIISKVKKSDGPIIQQIISNQTIILKAMSTGATIPNPDPLLELQHMFATGQISEENYLRRMITI